MTDHRDRDLGPGERGPSQELAGHHSHRMVGADLRERWLPDDLTRGIAAGLFGMLPGELQYVVVGMVQPGKQRGIWMLGQRVFTVRGALFLAADDDTRFMSWRVARGAAVALAQARLAETDEGGTVAYATISRDGHVTVTEWR
ncbi:MAG TPA: hypothetical protein VH136_18675 [Trebonia sp.]|jgi:hypothetical protein|nr:hypothetical protein [Trebonia sp.]